MSPRIIPEWYKKLLFYTMIIGVLIVLPIKLIFFYPEDLEEYNYMNIEFYCYLKTCEEGIQQVYGLTDEFYKRKYLQSFEFKEGCTSFQLHNSLLPYLRKLPDTSKILVHKIEKDSSMAVIKLPNQKEFKHPAESYYINLMVPTYCLHEFPPPTGPAGARL